MQAARYLFLGLGLTFCHLALAQGGPPLITDDPGTPGANRWEINLAWTHIESRSPLERELPLVDANFGVGERIQLKLEGPWAFARGAGVAAQDLGAALIGVKWRFQDEKGGRPSLSVYPQIETLLLRRSVRLGIAESGVGYLLPLEVQFHRGKTGLNFDLGVMVHTGGATEWTGGLASSFEPSEGSEFLVEVHGSGVPAEGSHDWVAQVGYRKDLSPNSTFLFSLGRSIATLRAESTRFQSYAGLQLRF